MLFPLRDRAGLETSSHTEHSYHDETSLLRVSHKGTQTSVSFALSHVLALKEASSQAVLRPTATWLSVETVPPSVEPSDDCGPFPSGLLLGSPLSSTGNWSSWRANTAEPSATKWTEAHLPSVPQLLDAPCARKLCQLLPRCSSCLPPAPPTGLGCGPRRTTRSWSRAANTVGG